MRFSTILLSFGLFAPCCADTLEFAGYISSPAGVQFILTDSESGEKSEFIKIDQSFRGHKIVAFDTDTEVITVRSSDGVVARLALRGASVKDSNWSQDGNRLSIVVSADGELLHNGKRLDIGALEKMFQAAAVDGWLYLHVKPTKSGNQGAMRKTMLLVMRAFRSSGVLGRIKWDELR